jgi:hypothetical protein
VGGGQEHQQAKGGSSQRVTSEYQHALELNTWGSE